MKRILDDAFDLYTNPRVIVWTLVGAFALIVLMTIL